MVVEIRSLAKGLLEVSEQRKGICSVGILRELQHGLQLDHESREVETVQVGVQRGVTQVLVNVIV